MAAQIDSLSFGCFCRFSLSPSDFYFIFVYVREIFLSSPFFSIHNFFFSSLLCVGEVPADSTEWHVEEWSFRIGYFPIFKIHVWRFLPLHIFLWSCLMTVFSINVENDSFYNMYVLPNRKRDAWEFILTSSDIKHL